MESWNGTAWTALSSMNTGRSTLGSAGTTTSALAFAGGSPEKDVTEEFNGSAWAEAGDLSTARRNVTLNANTQSASTAYCTGGWNPPQSPTQWQNITEEWTITQNVKTITD